MAIDLSTIHGAVSGDYDAMERILSHYDDYITAMSHVTARNEKGILVRYMDVEIRECIRAKLLAKILEFDLTVGTNKKLYDLATDAAAFALSLSTAVETAIPGDALASIGTSAATGLASAIASYAMTSTGTTVGQNVKSAVSAALTSSTLRSVGVNAMAGLKDGINAGKSGVVSAMKSAAQAAVSAAKKQLKIASPSGVFREEVGRMTMKGFGQGVLLESKLQAKTVANAARYLTGAAQGGSISTTANDNRRTYNQTSSVNLSGNTFYVRDEQDIRSLAMEIATLTKRQQRGRGLKMA